MSHRPPYLIFALPLALLTGCALQTTAPPSPVAMAAGLSGTIMGGQQPISGSTVNLIAIGQTGYGVPASNSVLSTTTTNANGGFTLPAFNCPSPLTPVMIEALGGNPGLASGTNNSAIFLAAMPALICSEITTSTHIHIDEVTTVATAYALRPFVNGNNVGTSKGNANGVYNAYATYNNLVNTATGTSPGASVPSGVAIPTATINSLANSLTACVNTTNSGSTACNKLFKDTGLATLGPMANVFNIAVAIAGSPQANASDIFNTAGSTPPFQPALTAAPGDWSLPVVYTSGNLKENLTGLDIDTSGNVWVAAQGTFSSSVEEIGPAGTLLGTGLGNGNLGNAASLAIDLNGSIVVGNSLVAGPSVVRFHGTTTDFVTKNANIKDPARLAIDSGNYIVVGDVNGNMVLLQPDGTFLGVYNAGSLNGTAPYDSGTQVLGVAADEASNDWGVDDLYLFYPTAFGANTIPGCNCPGNLLAFDSGDDAYVAGGKNLYEITNNQQTNNFYGMTTQAASTPVLFGGNRSAITAMAIDGLSKIWLGVGNPAGFSAMSLNASPNSAGTSLTTSNVNDLLPATNSLSVTGLAIDGSGNVWLSNGAGGGLYELVGAAAPVTTPLSVAAANKAISTEP